MSRSYDQSCGVAAAAEILGERWTLLVVRDLLVGPQRYNDLLAGLPGISTNTLAARLRDLEAHGVVDRAPAPRPDNGLVYRLTAHGRGLEDAVVALGAWGGAVVAAGPADRYRRPARPVVAAVRLRRALAAAGAPDGAYLAEIGDTALTLTVTGEGVDTRWGAPDDPAAALRTDHATLTAVLTGRRSAAAAARGGALRITGRRAAAAALRTALDRAPGPVQDPPGG